MNGTVQSTGLWLIGPTRSKLTRIYCCSSCWAGAGALTGGGPNLTTTGVQCCFIGKQRVKNEVLKAANKYEGQALNNGEKKLLREFSG